MKVVVHPHYANLTEFIRNLPHIYSEEGEMLYDKRNKVKRFQLGKEILIVKKFKRPNLIQRIVYTFFKKSKAERAYLYAGIFRERGFQTPHEIAYIEIKERGLFSDGYFISNVCDDKPLLPILNREDFDRELADHLSLLLVNLHQKGILHGDINLNNVLYHIENREYRFTLIDTNRSRFTSSPSMLECMENLKRLTHNKALMDYVVRKYARAREWSEKECTSLVFRYLSAFESKVQQKRCLQSLLGIKKDRK